MLNAKILKFIVFFLYIHYAELKRSSQDEALFFPTQRIVGGTPTRIDNYPFLVEISIGPKICAGTILSPLNILSAAHCFLYQSVPISAMYVLSGSDVQGEGARHNILTAIIHENYARQNNDIALVILKNGIEFSRKARAAILPPPYYELPSDTPVSPLGWGQTFVGSQISQYLQIVTVFIVEHSTCTQRYRRAGFDGITDNMICAGILDVGGKDACQGDSGGPLLHENMVVGVTSFGIGCADSSTPGVYTKVSKYIGWINLNMHADDRRELIIRNVSDSKTSGASKVVFNCIFFAIFKLLIV